MPSPRLLAKEEPIKNDRRHRFLESHQSKPLADACDEWKLLVCRKRGIGLTHSAARMAPASDTDYVARAAMPLRQPFKSHRRELAIALGARIGEFA